MILNTDQNTEIRLRPATIADQPVIAAIIHEADINPMGLQWERFLLAEENGQVIGTGQLKPHSDGSIELASIAVVPTRQGQGIGSQIVRALIVQHFQNTDTLLYLTCLGTNESYYVRFGFRRIGRAEMPPYFRRITRIARVLFGIGRVIRPKSNNTLAVMRYDPKTALNTDAL